MGFNRTSEHKTHCLKQLERITKVIQNCPESNFAAIDESVFIRISEAMCMLELEMREGYVEDCDNEETMEVDRTIQITPS